MERATLELDGARITVVPVIRGLVSEAYVVAKAFDDVGPDSIALSISPEELTALRDYEGEKIEPMSGTVEENVYEGGLAKFGEVARPPKCFLEALERARPSGVKVVGVDLTESEFTKAYCDLVSGWDFARRTFGRGRFARAKFDMSSAEAFVLDWDRRLRRSKGYDLLERRREAQIARGIGELAHGKGNILALVETERFSGVVGRLREMDKSEARSEK